MHREDIARLAVISALITVISGCLGSTRQSAGPGPGPGPGLGPGPGQAQASGGGEACAFSAPGVAFGLVGHIGWGFELRNGTWEFGANEGPFYWPPRKLDISRTWEETGSFSAMLATFRQGGPYERTSFYTTYRCRTVSKPDAARAATEVSRESHEHYAIPGYDCLSQVYNVLTLYGATGLPSDIGVFDSVPNIWYEHLSGFSAPGSLNRRRNQ